MSATRFALGAVCVSVLTACGSAGFSGSGGAKQPAKKPDAPKGDDARARTDEDLGTSEAGDDQGEETGKQPPLVGVRIPPQNGGGATVPPDCGPAGATQAQLISTTVENKVGAKIVYDVSRVDCNGKPAPIVADVLLFDVNAQLENWDPMPFTVSQDGGSVTQGALEQIVGSDLFGHKDESYAHLRTDKRLQLTGKGDRFRLEITLTSAMLGPPDFVGSTAGDLKLQTYLRFGDAAPVEKDVVFRAAP